VSNATKDYTLVRKCSVTQGETDWTVSAGTDVYNSQWIVRPKDDFSNIDQHEATCADNVIPVYGCLDPLASNYAADLTGFDASCTYPGCTDPTASNYSFTSWSGVDGTLDPPALSYASGNAVDNGSCLYPGCNDQSALNYDSGANEDDGTCEYFCDAYIWDVTFSDASCFGGNSGTATVSGPNAITIEDQVTTLVNTYQWSNADGEIQDQIASSIDGLSEGTYSVTITEDANGCSATVSVVIGEAAELVINSVDVTPATPFQSDGSFTANVTGGTGDLTYEWSSYDGSQTYSGNDPQVLSQGYYNLVVTDANGCTASSNDLELGEATVEGCTDVDATNFDANVGANTDDGSCYYEGCMDQGALNFDENADTPTNDLCCYVEGCMDSDAFNYDENACIEDENSCVAVILGCMDASSINHNPSANTDDGSCVANLFFSEYAEGSSNNKYLEIYNPSNNSVDLSNYAYPSVSNAPSVVGMYEFWNAFDEGATIAPGEVYIIAHGSSDATILALADETHNYMSNGDDGYALVYGSAESYTVMDWLGNWDGDPGSSWSVAGVSGATKDNTLVRKCNISQGNNDWFLSAGTDIIDSEWIVNDNNDWTSLGSFTTCATILYGCMDQIACNYDADANTSDGSCAYDTFSVDTQDHCDSYTWIDGNTYTTNTTLPVAATSHIINSGMYYYSPSSLTINEGDTVFWINDQGNHNVNFDVSSLTGDSYGNPFSFVTAPTSDVNMASHVFSTSGTYNYDCSVGNHAVEGMVGVINVIAANVITYNVPGGNSSGCDSIVTLDLTINYDLTDLGCGCDLDGPGTYYADLDGDGLGFGDALSICAASVTSEVTNNDDTDDNCASNVFDCSGACVEMQ
jgi:plastocyanin